MNKRAQGTLQGAGTGAAMGSYFGPWGTAIGGLAGGALGYFTSGGGSGGAEDAANAQRQGLDAAMKRLQEFSAQQYAQRQQDLAKTMAFYGPAERYLQSIYAQPQVGSIAPGAPKQGIPGVGGQLANPPGFPKVPTDPTFGYGQGPGRGF